MQSFFSRLDFEARLGLNLIILEPLHPLPKLNFILTLSFQTILSIQATSILGTENADKLERGHSSVPF